MEFNEPVPLIHNPAAGGGRGRFRFKEAQAALALKNILVEPVETKRPGHAIELMEQVGTDEDVVFVLGGDGTLSESANGALRIPESNRPLLGFLPAGTGNDFLRDFGLNNLQAAINNLATAEPRGIDVAKYQCDDGTVGNFINIFGTGFAADAADLTNRKLKWIGKQAYNTAVLMKLASLSSCPTTITLDGKEIEGDLPLVMVCNSMHCGGAMQMAPGARPDDGLLDVITVEGATRRELLSLLMKLQHGTHVEHQKVEQRQGTKIRIEPQSNGPLLVDGEVLGTSPVSVELDPGALQVVL